MRGLCLPEVVHRFADPPARVDTARVCGGETSRSQLHTGRAGGEGDIEAVVDEQDGRTDGQANSKLIMLETREGTAPGGEHEVFANRGRALARDFHPGPPAGE